MGKNKLNVLQSWRFLAFLTIFIHHSIGIINVEYGIAGLGVEFFFVLSGFLMAYNYWTKFDKKMTKKELFQYIIKKVKKFYPVFIIALILKTPITLYKYYLEIGGINLEYFVTTISRFIPSIFLVQSYIPDINYFYAFNGVAWFLDVLILCYLLTPFVIRKTSKLNKKKLFIIMLIVSVLKWIYNTFIVQHFGTYEGYSCYIFPLYRFFDYLQGILLGGIFLQIGKDMKYKKVKMSILEIGVCLLILLGYCFRVLQGYETIQEILSILVVIIFAFEGGVISKILNNKILVYLGSISMELYLIHQPIIKYFEFFSKKINNTTISYVFFVCTIIISLLLAICINKYLGKMIEFLHAKIKRNDKNTIKTEERNV